MKSRKKCERCARRTSFIGLLIGIIFASFKIVVGFLGGSRALIASGMCNVSDVSSALVVLLGVRYANKSANKRYQYGFGKVEFVAQVSVSVLMIIGTVVLILSSCIVISHRLVVVPHIVVFFVAVISMISNGLMYKFAHCGAKQLNSPALHSHAEHNKIDVASSVLVAIGVLAARIGLHWADPLIAIFESLHVIHGSVHIAWDGIKGMMDANVSEEYLADMKKEVLSDSRIKKVPMMRGRQSGSRILLDMAIEIDQALTVFESKVLVQGLRKQLRKKDKYLSSIFVQILPAVKRRKVQHA